MLVKFTVMAMEYEPRTEEETINSVNRVPKGMREMRNIWINPSNVINVDQRRNGITADIKLVNGCTICVKGTLDEVAEKLNDAMKPNDTL